MSQYIVIGPGNLNRNGKAHAQFSEVELTDDEFAAIPVGDRRKLIRRGCSMADMEAEIGEDKMDSPQVAPAPVEANGGHADLSSFNVRDAADVIDACGDPDKLEGWVAVERDGKGRVTVIANIEKRIASILKE